MKRAVMQKPGTSTTIKQTAKFEGGNDANVASDCGLLILRLDLGGLLAGHGSQKLFGWFNGPGPQGTAAGFESMDLKPGPLWAFLAGASELGGGILTALGLLHPLGSLSTIGAMIMAIFKANWRKPVWATQGEPSCL